MILTRMNTDEHGIPWTAQKNSPVYGRHLHEVLAPRSRLLTPGVMGCRNTLRINVMKPRRITPPNLVLAVIILASSGPWQNLPAQMPSLFVEGRVTNTLASNVPFRDFSLRSDGNRWSIWFSGIPGVNDSVEVFYEAGKTYYLCNMESVLARLKAEGRETAPNIATGMIRRDPVPLFPMVPEAGIVWLTYLSGLFFVEHQGAYMTPPYKDGFMQNGFLRFEDLTMQRILRGPLLPFLKVPESVDFLFDVTNAPRQVAQFEEPYRSMANARFTVVERSLVNRQAVPSVSLLEVFVPSKSLGSAPDPQALTWSTIQYRCRATNITVLGRGSYHSPSMPGLTHVTDFRFAVPQRHLLVSYEATQWLSDADVKGLREYKVAIASLPAIPVGTTGSLVYALVVALVVLVMAVPIIFALKGRITRNQKQTKE